MTCRCNERGGETIIATRGESGWSPAIRWSDLLARGGFLLLVAWFLALKSYCIHWQVGDENIYYYMAWSVVDHGALPYRDFFFAHPPLHLLPGVIAFAWLGFGPLTARCLPIGATVVGATFLFLLAKRHLGCLAAVAAVALYLNSFEVLGDSTHWTGINLAVMWLVMGLWALFRQRPATAGMMLALGVGTSDSVLPGALMSGLLTLLGNRRSAVRYALGFGVPWVAVQAGCFLLGGRNYWDSVYLFHFIKPAMAGGSFGVFAEAVTNNFAMVVGSVVGLVFVALDEPAAEAPGNSGNAAGLWELLRAKLLHDGPRGFARTGALWALGYGFFIATLPAVFSFYLLPIFPGLALVGGFAVERFVHHTQVGIAAVWRRTTDWWIAVRMAVLVVVACAVAFAVRVPLQRILVPTYVRAVDVPMTWSASPLPINAFMRWCCWDDVARAYTAYGTLQEMLYHESRYFEQAETLAAFVRQNSRSDQILFGDSSTTGLIALLAGRRVAADYVDTNVMRFSSGLTAAEDVIRQVDTPALAFVLVQGRTTSNADGSSTIHYAGFAAVPPFRSWLDGHFDVAFQVEDRTKGTFILLRRRPP